MRAALLLGALLLGACGLGDLLSPRQSMCEVGWISKVEVRNDTSFYTVQIERVACADTAAWRRAHP